MDGNLEQIQKSLDQYLETKRWPITFDSSLITFKRISELLLLLTLLHALALPPIIYPSNFWIG